MCIHTICATQLLEESFKIPFPYRSQSVLPKELISGTGLAVCFAYDFDATEENDGCANIWVKSLVVHRQHSHSSSDLVCILHYLPRVVQPCAVDGVNPGNLSTDRPRSEDVAHSERCLDHSSSHHHRHARR